MTSHRDDQWRHSIAGWPPRHAFEGERSEQRRAQKPLKDRVRKLEKDMERLTEQLKAVELRLADPELYNSLPAEELDALLADAGRLRRQLEQTEEGWLEASEALEAAGTP